MIALDANILIYACDKADLKRQQVALDLVSNARDGVLLWQVACEFVAASRKLRSQGFTMAGAWDRVLHAEDTAGRTLVSTAPASTPTTTSPGFNASPLNPRFQAASKKRS
jgi:predicted nucleic acid-binding protein